MKSNVSKGRDEYRRQINPVNERAVKKDEAKDSGVTRGRLLWRARHGDSAARAVVDQLQADDPDGPSAA